MTDKRTSEEISRNMRAVGSKNTKPEETVRKRLFAMGLRYRKNDRRYPGSPDAVFPKYKAALFVNGCFWHRHKGCPRATVPESNREYWLAKFARNVERDERDRNLLEADGWRVVTVLECELKKKTLDSTIERLYREITGATPETK